MGGSGFNRGSKSSRTGWYAIGVLKKFWQTVGGKVQEEVLAVLNGGGMPVGWNETTVVLIPKVKSPEKITEYRPISLCNVLYKLISKVLANRLKVILPDIISPTQSAFVPGRMITDNVLLAYEITHLMHSKKVVNAFLEAPLFLLLFFRYSFAFLILPL
jgi:hypothetical protein